MDLDGLLKAMVDQEASDLFLKVGNRPFLRLHGRLLPLGDQKLDRKQLTDSAGDLMGPMRRQVFHAQRELNFAFERPGLGRFRANVLWQRGLPALVIRRIPRECRSLTELNLPAEVLIRMMEEPHGLILVTGPTGSGKSTTVAALLNHVNQTLPKHIVTLEDPIEFQFEELQAVINQREIGEDTLSFSEGLKNVLRQSPDILYLSDIRDQEGIEAAVQASEAGQLVLSCLHTTNTVTTVERVVAFFPPHQQHLIRLRLSLILRGIVSLRLLRRRDGQGRIPATEVLIASPTVRDLIRDGRTEQLPAVMRDSALYGMQTFAQSLYQRCREGSVELEEALRHADSPEELQLALREIRATRDVHP